MSGHDNVRSSDKKMNITPTPASTVLIGREKKLSNELEILLLLRNKGSSFMPSYYVFPGGAVEKHDRDNRISRIARPEDTTPDENVFPDCHGNSLLTYKYAAIRETFEECGLLLAEEKNNSPALDMHKILQKERQRMSEGTIHFIDMLTDFNLEPVNDELFYLTSFVTPEFSPIRFDAKFFFARCPQAQEINIDGSEIVDYTWATPAEAMKKNGEGSLPLAIPTQQVIKKFAPFSSYSSTIDALFTGNMLF